MFLFIFQLPAIIGLRIKVHSSIQIGRRPHLAGRLVELSNRVRNRQYAHKLSKN
jgi:hypothetical protein